MEKKSRWPRILLKSTLWAAGVFAVMLMLVQATLSEKVLTKIINKYAAEYVDGEVSFGSASVSVFKRFPRVFLALEDFHITYPSERGEEADTLASFKRFSASLDVAALMNGTIKIPHLRLVQPRIFAHEYADGKANWDIIKVSSSEETEDTTSLALPKISLGRISLSRHPHIVYTNSKDTVFAVIDVARIGFNGQIETNHKTSRKKQPQFSPRNTAKGLTVDSLRIAGRIKKDTIALSVKKFYVQEKGGQMDIDAKAKAMLATNAFGRIHLPIEISGKLDFPKDTIPVIALNGLKANVGDFPLIADANVRILDDKAAIKARLGIQNCALNDVFHGFAENIIPELSKVETDAKLTMIAECDGDYIFSSGELPKLSATISLPEASLRYSDVEKLQMKVGISASGYTDSQGRVNMAIERFRFTANGLDIDVKGKGKDLLGGDPSINVDGKLHASLDTLVSVLPDTLGIIANGEIAADIQGSALLSQLSIYNFSQADIIGNLKSDQIIVQMPSDSIDVDIKGLDVFVGPEERISRRDSTKSFRLAGITAKVKRGKIAYGETLSAHTNNLLISAKNSVSADTASDNESRLNPLSGRLSAESLVVKDAAGAVVNLTETSNSFTLRPKRNQPTVPVLSLTSSNKKITLSQDKNRAILAGANLKVKAEMNTADRRQKDSLLKHAFAQREKKPVPSWMQEEDFIKQDIDIRLDETLAKYFREWDLNGQISVSNGNVITPYFPINNALKGFELNFTNDEVKVDKFRVVSGKSDIDGKGTLTGLRRAFLGRSTRNTLKLNLDISSNKMDADELMTAYQKGLRYHPADTLSVEDSTITALIVIPANLDACINLNARNATYDELIADTISAKFVMKERCLQITETKAHTNMGEITFDAFYSTQSKKDLKAGFDLNFKDITADKAISLMPTIDTLMPILKSFSGNFNCEIAATASLDTNMNLIMPTINGIMRISGDNLLIAENDTYRSLARKLMLKDKKEGHIDNMLLEAVIEDSTLEIFPFVISLDRYMLAMSGIQNLDMSYRYHASVIKSPLPVKLGIDIYGQDFDNMKFKVGQAKYKSSEVPVFSAVIEETKINLLDAIHNIFIKGVDATINEAIRQTAIRDHIDKIGYVRAVDMQIEELTSQEQKQIEESEESMN